jgi:hypothetical protein
MDEKPCVGKLTMVIFLNLLGMSDTQRYKNVGNLAVLKRLLTGFINESKWTGNYGGVFRFSVISTGISGFEWIERLEIAGSYLSEEDKKRLCSKDFIPTTGAKTEIVVFSGGLISHVPVDNLSEKREYYDGLKPNDEAFCLIRENYFSDDDLETMDIWWIDAKFKSILSILSSGKGYITHRMHMYSRWNRKFGFIPFLK